MRYDGPQFLDDETVPKALPNHFIATDIDIATFLLICGRSEKFYPHALYGSL
jgi:hypothetical protein